MAQVNMGPRKVYATRLPSDVAALFEEDAHRLGLSYSQYMADVLAERYDRPLPSQRFRTKKQMRAEAQEVLPLDRAS